MSTITKAPAAKNSACAAITSLLDSTGLYSTGHVSIYTSDATKLTWHQLSIPAFGTPVDGTSMAYPINDSTVLTDGTAATFSFDNRDGTSVFSGIVSLPGMGGALELESLVLPKDSTVAIAGAKYIVPA